MNLYSKIGDMEFDGLITDLNPPVIVGGGELSSLTEAAVLKRGTLLAKADGMLCVHDGSGEADCILCDDTEVGTESSVNVTVYLAGCFNPEKVEAATGCAISEDDKNVLRTKNIYFKAPQAAN